MGGRDSWAGGSCEVLFEKEGFEIQELGSVDARSRLTRLQKSLSWLFFQLPRLSEIWEYPWLV